MKCASLVLAVWGLLLAAAPAWAGSWPAWLRSPVCVPNCACAKCCDDYCPKPCPRFKGVCEFVCDDYRPKSAPCVPAACGRHGDDYDRKCVPDVNCRPASPLRCPPTAGAARPLVKEEPR